ncbi:hypothetical protein [Paraburkholderia flava]|uniref:hypothetical protein n=1 Tax=Paraburkholderia flava TaxID=2547393 RepID=UPI00105D019A|nr:hypothetical protein [Paraburkholderia flava]
MAIGSRDDKGAAPTAVRRWILGLPADFREHQAHRGPGQRHKPDENQLEHTLRRRPGRIAYHYRGSGDIDTYQHRDEEDCPVHRVLPVDARLYSDNARVSGLPRTVALMQHGDEYPMSE